MGEFAKKNRWITACFFVSIGVIISYILTWNLPELFNGAGLWYNILFQLAIGYVINFMFYVTQVYLPNKKHETKIKELIAKRIDKLIRDMDSTLCYLAKKYANKTCSLADSGNVYTEEELAQMMNLRFSDTVDVEKANIPRQDKHKYFTVREWLRTCIHNVEDDIDKLYKYYGADISIELMDALENILGSSYHSIMPTLLTVPNDVNFSSSKLPMFSEYYRLIQALRKIREGDYS